MTNQDIKDFLTYCGITATKTTLKKIKVKIVYVDKYFKGKLDKLTLKDIHGFLSHLNRKGYAKSTRNDFTKVFKRFLKWKYDDWSSRFKELKDLKSVSNDQRQISKEDLLSQEEIQMIINATDSMKYKTLFLLLSETAGRPEEILKLKWKDINFPKKEVKLHSSKTDKIRTIPIYKTLGHLERYKEECFYVPPKAGDLIFDISNQTISNNLNKVEEKLKFTRHLYPYLFRHSTLSKYIRILSPKVYEMYAGHSLETGMKIYAHLDNEDLREELDNKIHNLKELTPEEKEEIKILKERIDEVEKNFNSKLDEIQDNNLELMKKDSLKMAESLMKKWKQKGEFIER